MEHFTPLSALLGGLLIGLSAALLLLANGRVAGVSGIVAGVLGRSIERRGWRLAFLAGLLAGSLLVQASSGRTELVMVAETPVLILAGLFVGLGTRLANGCTSGHAVCGVARLSRRSLAATATFLSTGGLTVFVVRHILGGS